MNQYTIYCTTMQAMKAFELGADLTPCRDAKKNFIITSSRFNSKWDEKYRIPTAEQMINWLADKEIFLEMRHTDENMFHIWVGSFIPYPDGSWTKSYPTIKEATLAAIDVALEYLSNQKNK